MTYVITRGCCSDSSCVAVCPVQCIRPRPGDPDFTTTEQLYIDPTTCIDCGAYMDACPVSVIHPDYEVPTHLQDYLQVNAGYFAGREVIPEAPSPVTRPILPPGRGPLRVAVIGAGPAACYAAAHLTDVSGVEVSVFDRLPTPTGLVRAGVAPDHMTTKRISDYFRSVLSRPSVRCFFNVSVGRDVSLADLRRHRDVVDGLGAIATP